MGAAGPIFGINCLIGVALLASFLVAFSFDRRRTYYLFYAAGFAMGVASGIVHALMPVVGGGGEPGYLAIAWLFLLCLVLINIGLTRQFQTAMPDWAVAAFALPAAAIFSYTWWQPETSAFAGLLYNLPFAILALTGSRTVAIAKTRRGRGQRALVILLASFGLHFASRPILFAIFGGGSSRYFESGFGIANEVITTVLMIAAAATFAALALADVVADLRERAGRDPLTGLLNRGGLAAAMQTLAAQRDAGASLWLVLGDLDHFKGVNDTFGHQAGDEVIRSFAAALARIPVLGALAARVGGEEFCIILPAFDPGEAQQAIDRVRADFASTSIPTLPSQYRVTASFGMARLASPAAFDDAYGRADAALYAAKRNGRNRLEVEDNVVSLSDRPRRPNEHLRPTPRKPATARRAR
jgi:diguanylate cyclase (GGDEF)-like protein